MSRRSCFQPNSCVVAEVRPSPNHGERTGRPAPRYDRAALHRHARCRCRAGPLVRAGQRGFGPLLRARRRPDRPDGAGEPPRLACRRLVLGRRKRYQFVLDRHRDRQSRPRLRLSGFSQAPDRGGNRALPRHPNPQHHSAGAGAGAFRRGAVAQAGPRREIPLADAIRIQVSAIGSSRRRSPKAAQLLALGDRGDAVAADAGVCSANMATASPSTATTIRPRTMRWRPSSAISGPSASTALSMNRRAARCRTCSRNAAGCARSPPGARDLRRRLAS